LNTGYQPRTNLVNDENANTFADSHSFLNSWKNYFCYVLNVHVINYFRQTEMHTAE